MFESFSKGWIITSLLMKLMTWFR